MPVMWGVFAKEAGTSNSNSASEPSVRTMKQQNFTFDSVEASTYTVDDSLDICKALFEQSWKSYDNEHYHLMWKDQLQHALAACKGLLNLSVRRLTDDYKAEANVYFIPFLVFVALSSIAIITLLYLI